VNVVALVTAAAVLLAAAVLDLAVVQAVLAIGRREALAVCRSHGVAVIRVE